jgi:hypothetical protein
MDPKVAQLVTQQVERARSTMEGDLNAWEPGDTRIARFAQNLLSVKDQRDITSLGRDQAPDILTREEKREIGEALSAVEDATDETVTPPKGDGLLGVVTGKLNNSRERGEDSDALQGLLDALMRAAVDDLPEGDVAPVGDSFQTDDGEYRVTVAGDGLTFEGKYDSGSPATFEAGVGDKNKSGESKANPAAD